jgi:hypothetical protein
MRRKTLASLWVILLAIVSGCASYPVREAFIRHNPSLATGSAEIYEIPLEQWIHFESTDGLAKLKNMVERWRRNCREIPDQSRRQEADRFLSSLLGEVCDRYTSELLAIHKMRLEMGEGDRIIYLRPEGRRGSLFVVLQNGTIRSRLNAPCYWEQENQDLIWQRTFEEIRRTN